jgi:HAE1 family hydrophobic/amphiphilic exporter-1
VISIALILASVFIPVALVSGIQGRLNKQFAVTIAVSVVISAFNALTLSPALAALMLRPRKEARGPLSKFFGAFNRWFAKATRGYVSLSRGLIRKAAIAVLILGGFALFDGLFGNRLPSSFLPEEDMVIFLNVQLPAAARWSEPIRCRAKSRRF